MVGNNTPVFFVRDPIQFPDFIHTQKRHPQTNLKDPDMFWDFLSLVPESLHQVTILFSDRGIPDGYRFMHGFGSHTFRLVNNAGEGYLAKFHFRSNQGIKNLEAKNAEELAGSDADYATKDLFAAIERKEFPSWTLFVQIHPENEPFPYPFNPLDVTKVWHFEKFPLMEVGKMMLNRNPDNYFAEIEQSAFSPSHMVPGIEASFDRMFQGRLFSYPDTHRHRLGTNYKQIPVNKPLQCPVANQQRDGAMVVDGNQGSQPNYEPNSHSGPKPMKAYGSYTPVHVNGAATQHIEKLSDLDFNQAARLWKLQGAAAQDRMIKNMAGAMSGAKPFIRSRQIENIRRSDKNWANRIEQEITKIRGSRI